MDAISLNVNKVNKLISKSLTNNYSASYLTINLWLITRVNYYKLLYTYLNQVDVVHIAVINCVCLQLCIASGVHMVNVR